ncbi:hypothetical protein ACIOWE_02670 [Pseudomonas sp. NPDC087598]|uniref:hypothetical protein n=1 Tax=Pseudomonas sp. NPDC087598 TaxID=3364440 RepID=UPI00381DFF7B
MKKAAFFFAITAAFGTVNVAHAEGPDAATLKGIYDMGRNTAGLIKHCVDKGLLKADSVDNANKMVGFVSEMPGEMDKSEGDKSEANGRKGEVLTEGKYQKLEANLPSNLTLKQWCEQADQGMREGLKSAGLIEG